MNRRQVFYSPAARTDLTNILRWIAAAGAPQSGLLYVERIERFVDGLDLASERGRSREEVRPGMRVAAFERRVMVAYRADDVSVTILRIFYGGQNWERAMSEEPEKDDDV